MSLKNILALIEHRMKNFTNAETKIAKFILEKPKEVLKMTINELSNACGVSDATVVRFVRKIDLETFQELKLSLANDLTLMTFENSIGMDTFIVSTDTPITVRDKVAQVALKTIEMTSSISSLEDYTKVAQAIRSANKIVLFGVGASSVAAQFLQYKLNRMGYFAVHVPDPHMQSILAATLTHKDIAVGISQSGSTKDTVDALKTAKEHGATTIAITEHKESPISFFADFIIETASSENPIKQPAGRSVLGHIFAVELLIGILYTIDYENIEKYTEETAKAVVKKLY
ncbi:MAG: MurR/RpiR family transcriptional regulator [Fervidobacterium sp.]|uniref:MurR/RpiR family transcriptional regulator n=1 Tax=Fervidobacterium sp. TaxID=1871331 RepID=UPI004049DB39